MDCSTPGFPVHHQLPQLTQIHVYQVGDAIQQSPLSSPSPPAFNLPQHQGLFHLVSSVVSDSLRPHGLQHAGLPCPSLFPEVCSNSSPLRWWCHPIILSSVVPYFCLQLFPAPGYFLMSQLFASMAKVLELQLQHQSFQWTFRTDFLWDWLVWSCCPRDSQESSPTPQLQSINSLVLSFLYGPTLTSIHDYWKNQSFDYMDLGRKSDVSAF